MRNESQIMTREDTPAIKLSYMPYKKGYSWRCKVWSWAQTVKIKGTIPTNYVLNSLEPGALWLLDYKQEIGIKALNVILAIKKPKLNNKFKLEDTPINS